MHSGKNTASWQGERLGVNVLHSRAGVAQQIVVENGQGVILFDAGDGTVRDMLRQGIAPDRIAGIFVTHGHFDHMGGLHSLLGFMRMLDRQAPLDICAPAGCTEVHAVVEGFKRCYPDSVPFELSVTNLEPGQSVCVADMDVICYSVVHSGSVGQGHVLDRIPAAGYRITCDDETVAITGDTGNCQSLKELIEGADMALIEATFSSGTHVSEEMIERVHLTEEIAEQLGQLAKNHILVHRVKKD